MIRQAISCDICGAEKRQTNHWFVAWEHDGELRVSGWSSRMRLRAGSKHLCGQACLHKLADEFMERTIAGRMVNAPPGEQQHTSPCPTDTSLTAPEHPQFSSSARLIPTEPPASMAVRRPAPALVEMPERIPVEPATTQYQETPRYASPAWRAEAWKRERERMMQA